MLHSPAQCVCTSVDFFLHFFFSFFNILFYSKHLASITGYWSVVLGGVGSMHNAMFVPCFKVIVFGALAS